MRNNTKVLQICSYYLGTTLYQSLFDSLKANNIDEDIYVFTDYSYKIKNEYPSNVQISKCYNKLDRYIFHIKHLKVLNDIQKKMDVTKYNVMHAHSLFSNGYIAYKLNQKYNIPYIVAVRNTDVNVFFKMMVCLRSLGIKILRNARNIIFISEPYKQETISSYIPNKYKKEIEEKSFVIPNGIDKFWHDNKMKNVKMLDDNIINLIYVGTLDSNKNVETTIKACEILLVEGYKVNFKVIGKIMDKKYKTLIANTPFLEYINHSPKEELIAHLRSSDIFVMPSKRETFGLVYAEAMSQGLPVIYTRGQGFDGQFEEGEVGYSVEYNSAEEIAIRIKEILAEYQTITINCLNYVDRFNWDKISKQYSEIYKK